MYYDGQGVPQDNAKAERWVRRAAEQGLAEAQFHLGAMYHFGQGVPQDSVRAHMWWTVAEANGSEVVRELLLLIESTMSRSEIRRATKLARAWDVERRDRGLLGHLRRAAGRVTHRRR